MSKRLNLKKVMAVLLSLAIAVSFMPGLGMFSADTVKAAVDWHISRTYGEDTEQDMYSDQTLKSNETSAELKVIGSFKKNDGTPYTAAMTYVWKKRDENTYDYNTVATTKVPSHTVTGIDKKQVWMCDVTDPNGDSESVYFYIYKEYGWMEDSLRFYYVNRGEAPALKVHLEIEKGMTAAGLGIKYEWYRWNKDKLDEHGYKGAYELVTGNTDTLQIPAVSEDCEYRCYITDAKNNKDDVTFNVLINAVRAPLFKVAYAAQGLKNPDDMTLADKAAVDAVKATYDALSPKQKDLFERYYYAYEVMIKHAVEKVNRLAAEDGKAKTEAALANANYKIALNAAKAKSVAGFKVKAKKGKKATASWKKLKGASGYQIFYSLKKNFKGSKKVLVKNGNKGTILIKKLKAKKTYYAKIRPLIKVKKPDGKFVNVYGKWSATKTFKTKKK